MLGLLAPMQIKRNIVLPGILLLALFACRKEDPADSKITPPESTDSMLFNLENETVKSYLDILETQPYRDGDYTYSKIDDYYRLTTPYRKDRPAPVTVEWEREDGCISQKVYVSKSKEFADAVSMSVKSSVSTYEIYNLIPGRTYYWKVLASFPDGSSRELVSSSFKTTGRRRFLKVDDLCNVRDLGGIPIDGGAKRIKYGLLFRGGEMNVNHRDYDDKICRLDSYGLKAMEQAGIAADLDLRTATEAIDITTSPLGKDVDYIRFEQANDFFYDKFWTTDDYVIAMQWTIDELRKGKPVFFHCIYGADRTGTLAFIIEALLGAGENELSIDYELTSFSYGLESPPRRRGPRNELSVYRYRQMVEAVLSPVFPGTTIQEKIRGFLLRSGISEADLDWFTDYITEQIPS